MTEQAPTCWTCEDTGWYFDETACSDPECCTQWLPCPVIDCTAGEDDGIRK